MDPYTSLDPFLGGMNTPMFVVTTVHPVSGERAGCLVGFASQCSIEPDRFAVWLSQRNHTYRVAMEARVLVVHGLAEGDRHLAELFGTQTGDQVDKFGRCSWRSGPGGAPVIDGVIRWFAGEILDRAAWGNHTGFLLAPIEASGEPDPPPLMFSAVMDLQPGHDA
jgi:flavin reductase (DIM6/NTAB) family NADH-FMN oxidoreductase RutF